MKMRNDSPFAVLTEVECGMVLDSAEVLTMDQLAENMEKIHPGLEFSIPALRRFVRRLREEQLREEVEDSEEAMESFAKAGKSGRARDGVLEAMRRRMYAQGLEAKEPTMAMAVFNVVRQEQKEDRAMALEERRMALEEENAKQEWKRQELEDARSALRLLPKITEILMGVEGTAEERLARARELLGGAGAKLLLVSKTG